MLKLVLPCKWNIRQRIPRHCQELYDAEQQTQTSILPLGNKKRLINFFLQKSESSYKYYIIELF